MYIFWKKRFFTFSTWETREGLAGNFVEQVEFYLDLKVHEDSMFSSRDTQLEMKITKVDQKKVSLITTASNFFSLITTLQQFFFLNNDGKQFFTIISITSQFFSRITTASLILSQITTRLHKNSTKDFIDVGHIYFLRCVVIWDKIRLAVVIREKNWLAIEFIMKNCFPSLLRKKNCWSVVIREKNLLAVVIKDTFF
jgi:hypothetical protein